VHSGPLTSTCIGMVLTGTANGRSAIWRCSECGAIVHVADEVHPVATCPRCGHIVPAIPDGGA